MGRIACFSLLIFSFLSFVQVPLGEVEAIQAPDGPLAVLFPYSLGAVLAAALSLLARRGNPPASPLFCLLGAALGIGMITLRETTGLATVFPLYLGGFLIGIASISLFFHWLGPWHAQKQGAPQKILGSFAIAYSLQGLLALWPYDRMSIAVSGIALLLSAVPLESLSRTNAPSAEYAPPKQALPLLLGNIPLFGAIICCLLWASIWGSAQLGDFVGENLDRISVVATDFAGAIAAAFYLWIGSRGKDFSPRLLLAAMGGSVLILAGWLITFLGNDTSLPSSLCVGAGTSFCLCCFTLWLAHDVSTKARALYCAIPNGLFCIVLLIAPIVSPRLVELLCPLAVIVFLFMVGLILEYVISTDLMKSSAARHPEKQPPCSVASSREDGDSIQDAGADPAQQIIDSFGLTAQEAKVFLLFAQGHTAPYIAEALVLSPHTVKTYLKRIYGKMGINSKEEAIALYHQMQP